MKLENEFTVEAPVQEAWDVMLDLERVTPCLPGASLTGESGDEYEGVMTVRMGPVSQKYNGTVHYEEVNEDNRRAVLRADGKDARGQGTASATITSTLHDEGGSTRVKVETDMQITGKAAQFGRGMQQEVATKIFDQFADCLEREIMGQNVREEPVAAGVQADLASGTVASGTTANGASSGTSVDNGSEGSGVGSETTEEQPRRRILNQDAPEPEPLDLGEASRDAVVKRLVPVVIGAGVLAAVIWLWSRRRAVK
ncbi:SRPBCC family protein [Rubrobacter aplysinae]|uniref:SRPBCC family protein n=1 Tax=Rubrobacter aplysinae TaxID=909625 RepID=UPI00064BE142|nr:SRPBCC family protein [Rubrobacter aplysinae]